MEKETMMKLEEVFISRLEDIDQGYDKLSEDGKKMAIQQACEIGKLLNQADEIYYQYETNKDRVEKEVEKNKDMIELEEKKIKVPWQRTAIDVAKIVVPCVVPLIIWRKSFKEMLKFEETGRVTSNASRVLHMPKIF